MKNIGALIVTGLAWLNALSVQDMITWLLASVLTVASIIYVILGIKNRMIEHKLKQKELEDLHNV